MKYDPAKFSLAIFLGKICIAIPGAYLGQIGSGLMSSTLSQAALIIVLVVFTIIITIVLIKIDVAKIANKIIGRISRRKAKPPKATNTTS